VETKSEVSDRDREIVDSTKDFGDEPTMLVPFMGLTVRMTVREAFAQVGWNIPGRESQKKKVKSKTAPMPKKVSDEERFLAWCEGTGGD